MTLGGQPIVFNTTTAVFIPKGTPYGPLTWKEFHRPHLQLSIVLGSGDPYAASSPGTAAPAAEPGTRRPTTTQDFDFEQYVVRSPMREAGPNHVEGRQNPTMTYISRTQLGTVEQLPRVRVDMGLSQPADPEDAARRLRRGGVAPGQRP